MSHQSIPPTRYFARYRTAMAFAILVVPMISGCSHFHSSLEAYSLFKGEYRTDRRARAAAKEVWDCKVAHCYANHCDIKGLRQGFIDGFVDACNGGGDCPPMFSPSKNGLFCHERPSCSTAWHNGYPLGAAQAQTCGFCRASCSRVHPCLRDVQRPVNPGCVRIEDYNGGYEAEPVYDAFESANDFQLQLVPEFLPATPEPEILPSPADSVPGEAAPEIPAPLTEDASISFDTAPIVRFEQPSKPVEVPEIQPVTRREATVEEIAVDDFKTLPTPEVLTLQPPVASEQKMLNKLVATEKRKLQWKNYRESSIAGMFMSRTPDSK